MQRQETQPWELQWRPARLALPQPRRQLPEMLLSWHPALQLLLLMWMQEGGGPLLPLSSRGKKVRDWLRPGGLPQHGQQPGGLRKRATTCDSP
jgi:hypothetical protein